MKNFYSVNNANKQNEQTDYIAKALKQFLGNTMCRHMY